MLVEFDVNFTLRVFFEILTKFTQFLLISPEIKASEGEKKHVRTESIQSSQGTSVDYRQADPKFQCKSTSLLFN